jgi:ABC-type microcin C transport system duplicated ATPase subunit YejF
MGLLPADAAEVTAESLQYKGLSGYPVLAGQANRQGAGALRGKDIALIFQDP